jgi:hypothetical protein
MQSEHKPSLVEVIAFAVVAAVVVGFILILSTCGKF